MNNALLQLKVKQRLNKGDSHDYPNLQCIQIVEAINKAQIEECRDIIKQGESTKTVVDDIQCIIKDKPLLGTNKEDYFETDLLPDDYFAYNSISIIATKDECKVDDFDVNLIEQGNANEFLRNYTTSPSFEWRETFCTIRGNRLRVHTGDEFKIERCVLTYYRYPREVTFSGCENEYGTVTTDTECEFKKDMIERIITRACKIIAGDIENPNQVAINTNQN